MQNADAHCFGPVATDGRCHSAGDAELRRSRSTSRARAPDSVESLGFLRDLTALVQSREVAREYTGGAARRLTSRCKAASSSSSLSRCASSCRLSTSRLSTRMARTSRPTGRMKAPGDTCRSKLGVNFKVPRPLSRTARAQRGSFERRTKFHAAHLASARAGLRSRSQPSRFCATSL